MSNISKATYCLKNNMGLQEEEDAAMQVADANT